jgi:hypothetical protein
MINPSTYSAPLSHLRRCNLHRHRCPTYSCHLAPPINTLVLNHHFLFLFSKSLSRHRVVGLHGPHFLARIWRTIVKGGEGNAM